MDTFWIVLSAACWALVAVFFVPTVVWTLRAEGWCVVWHEGETTRGALTRQGAQIIAARARRRNPDQTFVVLSRAQLRSRTPTPDGVPAAAPAHADVVGV